MNKQIRVLIVEDNEVVTQTVQQAVQEIGHQVVGLAIDGLEAVTKTADLKPDVILMDIKLPGIDGLEAARRIQQSEPTPVVVLTAYESKELLDTAGEAGVAVYLTKPPNKNDIERAIFLALARFKDMQNICRLNAELDQQNKALIEALSEIKKLSGLLPICSACKQIRDDQGYWNKLEKYIQEHSEAVFTHSICPDCFKKLYPQFSDD